MRTTDDPWSATADSVRQSMREQRGSGSEAVVATVVNVEESGYRRPGARMVVVPDGERLGAVTAGCITESVTETARRVSASGTPRLETFDLRGGDADAWGLGLGCNGVIDVLVEPVDASFDPALSELREKRAATVLTAVETDDPAIGVGDRTVITRGRGERLSKGRPGLPEAVVAKAESRLDGAASGAAATLDVRTSDGDVRVFANDLAPTPELLVFGGHGDVNPVASLGAQAGFRVRVAAARGAHADESRFPAASEVTAVHPAELAALVDAPDHTYVVLMSHNFVDDRLALESILGTEVPYVGVMGPRRRFDQLREAMDRELDATDRERIAAPCGLDIGGDGPSTVGLSVVSELLAVHNGRSGARLTDRAGPIHGRPELG
ncbi:XdhC family protein [Haloferax volcanii]|uniref:XdhC family protein n=3 Tax=Haloferax TaxID=2251 RepID=L9VIJ9_HALVD|nr:XdhC/CoxI family protein [Haloferax volcanii]ELY36901.1 hypothetical protein C498_02105 [Haloferax volcanii DS2]MBS8118016.1 XdhC family protein [Haloferax volcanii]MBS8123028.1 XdhC family protein [Haloferax volcanii]MBS8126896.1 XdhC family protein [Haloferax volcanii]MBS8130762.1 XdhC family protein [Haloferax volcanii]